MTSPAQVRKRIEFVDLLRGWAVIVMIETHVMNAALNAASADTVLFHLITFVNGLVAPSFLFASGLAYAVTTRRKVHDYLSLAPPFYRQIGRLLLVLGIGYGLHVPRFNFHHLVYTAGEQAWRDFFQVDILQCIAVSLLLLQVLLLLLKDEARLYRTTAWIAAGVVVLTPPVWGIDFWKFLPIPIASYMNGLHSSLFPLFPWSAFLFAGAIVGYRYVLAKEGASQSEPRREQATMKRIAWSAAAIIAISFAIVPFAPAFYPVYDYWRVSPSFFLLRLGLVLLLCAGMFWYEKARGVSPSSPVTLIGRESLLVYTVHLILIYGRFGTWSFWERFGKSLGAWEAILATALLMASMYLLALFWSSIKHGPHRRKLLVQTGLAAVMLVIFFLPES